MRKNDSFEIKLIRLLLPLILYLGVQLIFQVILGIYALWDEFRGIYDGERANYHLAYLFLENTQEYMQTHGLLIILLSGCVAGFFLMRWIRQDERERFGLYDSRRFWKIDIYFSGMCVAGGIFAAGGLGKMVTLFPIDHIFGDYEQVSSTFMSNPLVFQILALCIIAPLVEEMIFRGLFNKRLEEYTDKVTAVMISALLFGIYHGNLVQGLYAGMLGILLCFVYDKCQSFTAPVLLHASANTASLVMMYSPVSTVINEHSALKVLVMFAELAILCMVIYEIYKKNKEGV